MSSRPRSRPLAGFIEPCLPRRADKPPAGPDWIHEIKHDGFRIMAQRADGRVRLLTRKGTNFSNRFPQIVAALTVLPVRSADHQRDSRDRWHFCRVDPVAEGRQCVEGPAPPLPWPWSRTRRQRRLGGRRWKLCLACSVR
jgi:hypothetical protein